MYNYVLRTTLLILYERHVHFIIGGNLLVPAPGRSKSTLAFFFAINGQHGPTMYGCFVLYRCCGAAVIVVCLEYINGRCYYSIVYR